MKDKYNMSIEGNIFYAKRNIIDSIWKSAHLEGIAVTYPETQEIYEGRTVSGLTVDEIVVLNNLKYSWRFLLEFIENLKGVDEKVSLPLIRQLNRTVGFNVVSNSGELRVGEVRIGGTDWKPAIPDYDVVKKDIEDINGIVNDTDRAITLMLYLMRSQLFWDGNKRTSMLVANYELIRSGRGIISISIKDKNRFTELLIEFYETNNMSRIKEFIIENCLDGTTL